jgi:act minimal PKS acyl carrier protein
VTKPFTIDDLKRFLRESAGEDEALDLDGEVLDQTFEELGYDSLALMETTSRIERALVVVLPEDAVSVVDTPRQYVGFVNGRLAART